MSNKVSRAKRKDLRAKGQLPPVVRVAPEQRATERRAVEHEASERVHAAREAIAEESEAPREAAEEKKKPRRDLTLLLLAGLTLAAALIFWLTQRSPTTETKIDAVPKLEAPLAGEPVKSSLTAPAMTAAPVIPAPPAMTAAPVIPAPPVITVATTAPAIPAAPEKPREKAADKPAEKPAPRPDKPKAAPKPAAAPSDPYG